VSYVTHSAATIATIKSSVPVARAVAVGQPLQADVRSASGYISSTDLVWHDESRTVASPDSVARMSTPATPRTLGAATDANLADGLTMTIPPEACAACFADERWLATLSDPLPPSGPSRGECLAPTTNAVAMAAALGIMLGVPSTNCTDPAEQERRRRYPRNA
jgi:hypothetical protein